MSGRALLLSSSSVAPGAAASSSVGTLSMGVWAALTCWVASEEPGGSSDVNRTVHSPGSSIGTAPW
jgi:hypothetical protein